MNTNQSHQAATQDPAPTDRCYLHYLLIPSGANCPLCAAQDPAPGVGEESEPLTYCAAGRDGDCNHPQCPQNLEGEPMKTGRHCPLDTDDEDENL